MKTNAKGIVAAALTAGSLAGVAFANPVVRFDGLAGSHGVTEEWESRNGALGGVGSLDGDEADGGEGEFGGGECGGSGDLTASMRLSDDMSVAWIGR